MKTKNFLAGLVVLTSVTITYGQDISLEAGFNLANVSKSPYDRFHKNMLPSLRFGIKTDFFITSSLSFQAGLLLSGKGTMTRSGSKASGTYYTVRSNPYYIEMPWNLIYKTPEKGNVRFFIGGGPYLAFGVGGKYQAGGQIGGYPLSGKKKEIGFDDVDPKLMIYHQPAYFAHLNRFDYGINGMMGVEGKSTSFSINYGLGLASIQDQSSNEDKHRVLSFTLGFKL